MSVSLFSYVFLFITLHAGTHTHTRTYARTPISTFQPARGSLPVDQAFVLQCPLVAEEVLLAERLAVLQLGQALVLHARQHLLELLVLLVQPHALVHGREDLSDLGQRARQVLVLPAAL